MIEARDIVERLKAAEADWWGLDDEENAMLANAAWAEIERLRRERDEAREYGKQARLRENAAEDARIHEQHRAAVAETEVAKLALEIARVPIEAMIEEVEKAPAGSFGFDSCGDGTVPGGLQTWDRKDEILHYLRRDLERVLAALAQPKEGQEDAAQ